VCYLLGTDDVYSDMLEYRHLLEASNYPRDHSLYSAKNMRVIGKMKDECKGLFPVGIRRASFENVQPVNIGYVKKLSKRTAYGVKNRYLAKNVTHDANLRTLRNRKIIHAKYRWCRSRVHKLQTVEC
jgi:hypothetical protein